MTTSKVRAGYEQLRQIVQAFGQQAEAARADIFQAVFAFVAHALITGQRGSG